MFEENALATKDSVQRQIEWHTGKILLTQDADGMIPSIVEIADRRTEKKKDIPRQSMATMALSFANTLVPSLQLEEQIERSSQYIRDNEENEPLARRFYVHLYRILTSIYSHDDPAEQVAMLREILTPELFEHPIAVNLYLRISSLLPKPLPHVAYLTETQRFNLSLTPRYGRFFDYADTLVWGKKPEPALAEGEYRYLLSHRTPDNWFMDTRNNGYVWSSVVGKLFEVFTYYGEDDELANSLYATLMSRQAADQYALDVLGTYGEHILSEENVLRIDDVHMHILVGLCYRYQALQ